MSSETGRKRKARKKTKTTSEQQLPPVHALYEASVQNVVSDAEFVERIWRKERGGRPHRLREDFCGTASLASYWVTRHRDNRSWGVDLDQETLEWGREHRVALLEDRADRVTLVHGNVLERQKPRVDVQVAFNFSYFTFHDRQTLGRYFRSAHQSLGPNGIFFCDLYGGSESMVNCEEETEVEGRVDPAGWTIPDFEYLWEQRDLNAIDHRIRCFIHFRVGGRTIRRAFSYDWRFWTLPELRELLEEAGFSKVKVYVEGWDDEADEGDGVFRRRKRFDTEGGWLAYLVALKG